MDDQQNPMPYVLHVTEDEVNAIINIIAKAPLPYNTSHHLITLIGSQVSGQRMQAQSATQASTETDDDEGDEDHEPREHVN